MRTLRLLLLIVALIVGQAQACRAVYLCRDGSVCESCPGVACDVPDDSCRVSASENEKGNCCQLSTCEDHHEADNSVSQASIELPTCILTGSLALHYLPIIEPRQARLIWLISHRPQAPPGEISLRAPPVLPA